MPEPLTSRQREILEYLRFRQKIRSYPPTVREIGEAVGLSSSSTVQNHLNTLERKGYIRRDPTKSRTIEVVDVDEMQAKLNKVVAVPLIGRVAAGQPMLAEENIEDHLVLSEDLVGSDTAFAHVERIHHLLGFLPGLAIGRLEQAEIQWREQSRRSALLGRQQRRRAGEQQNRRGGLHRCRHVFSGAGPGRSVRMLNFHSL